MKIHLTLHSMNQPGILDDKQFLFSKIAYHIAPVLLENKPSCLITFKTNGRNLYSLWEQHQDQFVNISKVDFFVLKKTTNSVCILFYIPHLLEHTLKQESRNFFLTFYGYTNNMQLSHYLEKLKERFEKECPHEMGIFLGYPLEDVKDFITYKARHCVLCGYWKVYHNIPEALRTFARYDKAKSKVLDCISKGLDPFSQTQQPYLYTSLKKVV